jgi:hypothetical protein
MNCSDFILPSAFGSNTTSYVRNHDLFCFESINYFFVPAQFLTGQIEKLATNFSLLFVIYKNAFISCTFVFPFCYLYLRLICKFLRNISAKLCQGYAINTGVTVKLQLD